MYFVAHTHSRDAMRLQNTVSVVLLNSPELNENSISILCMNVNINEGGMHSGKYTERIVYCELHHVRRIPYSYMKWINAYMAMAYISSVMHAMSVWKRLLIKQTLPCALILLRYL